MLTLKIKLILAAIAVAFVFAAGFQVGGWRCSAQQVAAIEQIKDEMQRRADEFAVQQSIDAGTAQKLAANLVASRRTTSELRRKLNDAKLVSGDCKRLFTDDFTSLWNDAIHAARVAATSPD